MKHKDYAFAIIKPPAKVLATRKIKNDKEYADLLEEARSKSACIYYAKLKTSTSVILPWELDQSTIGNIEIESEQRKPVKPDKPVKPETKDEPKIEAKSETQKTVFKCKICGKETTSKPGLTNHMKAAHPNS